MEQVFSLFCRDTNRADWREGEPFNLPAPHPRRETCPTMVVRAQHSTLEAAITAAVAATFKPRFPKCTRAS